MNLCSIDNIQNRYNRVQMAEDCSESLSHRLLLRVQVTANRIFIGVTFPLEGIKWSIATLSALLCCTLQSTKSCARLAALHFAVGLYSCICLPCSIIYPELTLEREFVINDRLSSCFAEDTTRVEEGILDCLRSPDLDNQRVDN